MYAYLIVSSSEICGVRERSVASAYLEVEYVIAMGAMG